MINNILINYIFPSSCLICASYTVHSKGFCSDCFNSLNFITNPYCNICGKALDIQIFEDITCAHCLKSPPAYMLSRSLLKFDEKSKNIIHAFKYSDKTIIGKIFARLIIDRYGDEFKNIDFIVPVPMNRFKRLFRMYNHSQILSQEISKITGVSHIADLLIKTKWTKSQTSLTKNQRERNLNSSLKFNKKYNIKGKTILIVDDVKTTGVTIKKCSNILKAAGAARIYVTTIAVT